MNERKYIEERLRAYIHPNVVVTEEQERALENAVDAQLEYESAQGGAEIPGNVQSFSVGNYSVTLSESAGGADAQGNLCPAAWAILYNAGLLRHAMPVAKRL